MKTNPLITIPLWALVIFGFVGALLVSIENITGAACPNIFSVPICYVVAAAYGLMLGSLTINHNGCKHHFFCTGWGTAFVIALFASIAEIVGSGGICPSTSSGGLRGGASVGIPMCYISLGVLALILVLFIQGPYRQACAAHNN